MVNNRRRWFFSIFIATLGLMVVAFVSLRSKGKVLNQVPPEVPESAKVVKSITAPALNPVATRLTATERESIGILQEIVRSRNDNDPRLDQLFRKMSPEMHLALESEYLKFPAEKRNARGLIAFLIARDLRSEQDLDFLKSIYNESPCLSVQDCSKSLDIDAHHAGVEQITANYPQLVTLYQLEKQLGRNTGSLQDQAIRSQVHQVLLAAAQFPVPAVNQKAEAILEAQTH